MPILGIVGGLFAILIGSGELLFLSFFWVSSHVPGSWLDGVLIPPQVGAILFILLGVGGMVAALSYREDRREPAKVILLCGLLGFPLGYASGSYLVGNWIYWIIPGTLLIAAGLIALVTPGRIASSLPLTRSGKREARLLGWVLYCGLFIAGLILVMGGLFLAGLPGADNSPQANATLDQRDFENAEVAESMGLLNESLKSYDDILARNQSNAQAWFLKGYALSRLGRYNEALACYNRALEIDPGFYQAMYAKNELQKELNRSNKTEG